MRKFRFVGDLDNEKWGWALKLIMSFRVYKAKELIKQLDEESK